MEIRILNNKELVADAVANEYLSILTAKTNAILGLATGGTPKPLYERLINFCKDGKISFKNVMTFNLDEYIGLESSHPQSYRYFMNENLFNNIDIDINNTFVPSGVGNITNNIVEYEKLLLENPIDVQLLGIGSNGHIAFNEPGTPLNSLTHEVDLVESTVKDNARFFESIEEVPKKAITMGIQSIKRAKKIILIATGENKADAINQMVNGQANNINCPASALQDHDNVIVFLDEAAASKINTCKSK